VGLVVSVDYVIISFCFDFGETVLKKTMISVWSSFACLAFVLPVVALQHGHHFENTAIVRAVDLGGSLVHVTTTYAIKALTDGSDIYTIALTPEEKAKTSWVQVKAKGQQQALDIWDAPPDYDPHRYNSSRAFNSHTRSTPLI
jgi:hypothetical protein